MTTRNSGVLPLQRGFNNPKNLTESNILLQEPWAMNLPRRQLRSKNCRLEPQEWNSSASSLSCSDDMMLWTTGPGLYKKFTMHLQVTDLDAWNIITNSNMPQTVVGLHRCIKSPKDKQIP
jgi:hypothetical protein